MGCQGFPKFISLNFINIIKRRMTMKKVKEIEQVIKNADIIVLDEGINKKGLGPLGMCCGGAVFPVR
jgi:hypothetical protein